MTATQATASMPLGVFAWAGLSRKQSGFDRLQAVELVCDHLVSVAEGRPLLVCVDDAHLLDPLSAVVVQNLVTSFGVSLLAAARPGDEAVDHLAPLWKDGWLDRIDVAGLERGDMEQLLETALGGPFHGSVAQWLWEATSGNALFMRELVLAGQSTGALRAIDGLWRMGDRVLPGKRMSDLVTFRLAGASPGVRRALELVAWSEPVDVQLLATLVTQSDLADAEALGAVSVEMCGDALVARLSHPVYAEVLRARTPALLASALQRTLADALEARGARHDDDVLRLASWRLQSGGTCDPGIFSRASAIARGLFDYELGERLADAAIKAGGGVESVLERADCLYRSGRFEEAEAQLAYLDGSDYSHSERARISVVRALNLMFGLGRPDDAERVLEAVRTGLVEADDVGRVDSMSARVSLACGALGATISHASNVLQRGEVSSLVMLSAAVSAAPALALSGHCGESLTLLHGNRQRAMDHVAEYPQGLGMLLQGNVIARWFAGDLTEAFSVAERLYQLGLQQRSSEATCVGAMNAAFTTLGQGLPRTAMRWAQEALGAVPEGDRDGLEAWCNALLAEAAAVAGDRVADEALARVEQNRRPALHIYDAQIDSARAWSLAANGDLIGATEILECAASETRERGALSIEALLLHHIVRFGYPERAVDRLNALAGQLDGKWVGLYQLHVNGLLAGDPEQLDRATDGFVNLGATICAAEAALHASRAYRAMGRESSRRAAAARSRTLLARCEGARTPSLLEPEGVTPLTRREREIAALAAAGMTSPAIADRLMLSVRTIEGHLHRLYAKLGVSCRDDLIARM